MILKRLSLWGTGAVVVCGWLADGERMVVGRRKEGMVALRWLYEHKDITIQDP